MTDHQSTELQSIVRFRFHHGQLEEFKRLSAVCIVLERFRDLDSLMQHSANIGDEMMAAIVATGECFGELLGDVPAELRANLAEGPVQVFLPYQAL